MNGEETTEAALELEKWNYSETTRGQICFETNYLRSFLLEMCPIPPAPLRLVV